MSTTVFSPEAAERLRNYLDNHLLARGKGSEFSACSIAAINLAISGWLTDKIPDCMSLVIGEWIITIQDTMPESVRNSQEWKTLLPLAAGTGRERETERINVLIEWMYSLVLPSFSYLAEREGLSEEWDKVLKGKDLETCYQLGSRKTDLPIGLFQNIAFFTEKAMLAIKMIDEFKNIPGFIKTPEERAAINIANIVWSGKGLVDWKVVDPCGTLQKLIDA